ncbi:MAG: YjjG family noncanonical pyrimidine nucleotidase [Ruminococcus sp.]|nr:YjjG family noncanonical pyrimidine nucleotidase [Ruminococcus sp.]MBR0510973.1 YjjG family noncanonical pyrimidine nucleotidase [Ruminococcus sp.]
MHHNLLFDLDQTLLDFHASEHIALKLVMEENGQVFTEEIYESFKLINKGLWLEFEKGNISKTELFETRFRLLFEKCGCDTGEIDLLRVNSDFIDHMSHNGVLIDGVLEFLEKIRESVPDMRVYVITNGVTRNALGRIASTGLGEHICRVFVSDTIGASKPAQEYFDYVKKAINEPDESCLVIGDSLTSDMLGAKNAGLASCWFMPNGDAENAMKEYAVNYSASSYGELYDVIMEWVFLLG